MRPWKLLETNYAYVKENPYQVAMLPLGATEPHNLHLPYGTDVYEGELLAEELCGAAHQAGAKIVLLPTIPYGTETNQMAFPLAMNVDPSTLFAMVTDLVHSLSHHGIRKLVLLNSHGGNEMKPLLRELHGKTDVQIFLCNWYTVCKDVYHEIFEHDDDHAGEMETSFILAYRPELVKKNADGSLAGDSGEVAHSRFDAVNRGWVGLTRPWHLLTTESGSGNPHQASAEKGHRLVAKLKERLVPFLVELSDAPLDYRFPFAPIA